MRTGCGSCKHYGNKPGTIRYICLVNSANVNRQGFRCDKYKSMFVEKKK